MSLTTLQPPGGDAVRIFGRRDRASTDPGAPGPSEPAPVEPESEQEPEPDPVRLLVIDDDDDLRELMTMALAREGFDIVGAAANADEALVLVAREPQPELILLDLHMPDVGGLELLPLLREAAPKARVVVCSAITASYMLEASLEAGAHAFIVKGVSAKSIATHLHRVATSGSVKVVRPFPLNRDYS